jgi:hypothetical protein
VLARNGIWSENHGVKLGYSIPFFAVSLCVTALMLPGADFQQNPSQDSTRSMSDAPVYLPPDKTNPGGVFPLVLYSLGEPSLFQMAKDVSGLSYRVSYMSSVPTRCVAARLVVSGDGTGQITTASSACKRTPVERTKSSASAADVEKFLRLIDNTQFWTMPSTSNERKTDASGHEVIVLDGADWMIEGLRNGSFHFVYRSNPEASPFTEVGRFLARDLAKLPGFYEFKP